MSCPTVPPFPFVFQDLERFEEHHWSLSLYVLVTVHKFGMAVSLPPGLLDYSKCGLVRVRVQLGVFTIGVSSVFYGEGFLDWTCDVLSPQCTDFVHRCLLAVACVGGFVVGDEGPQPCFEARQSGICWTTM